MFGIELRRKGNVTNLYADIGLVLEKAGVRGNNVSSEVQSASVAHSLQRMLNSNYFDVCTIRNCAELTGLIIPKERFNVYQTQHCVYYNEMLPEYKQILLAMVLDDFKDVLNPQIVKDVSCEVVQ